MFRVLLPLWVEGDDFTADYTTEDLVFTDASCTSLWLGSGPEAVFSYEMTSGETVVFAQGLGVDGQLLIQGTCSASGVCLDTADDGLDGDVESIIFTAPSAGTYYFIVKSYSAAPDPSTYAIALYAYESAGEVSCGDLFDNDGDSLWDCEDPDCAGVEPCGAENTIEHCTDQIDNDNDGFVDCADSECGGIGGCVAENDLVTCADTIDNDGDGRTDCADDGCSGIGSCPTLLLNEGFETWPPAGWTIVNGGNTTYTWQSSTTSTAGVTLTGGTGKFAIVDSDEPGMATTFDDSLVSPVMDCTAYTAISLSFRHYYNDFSGSDSAAVEISTDGATWTPVQTWTADTTNGVVETLDLSAQAAGQSTFQIRFRYVTTSYDYYWLIDSVVVTAN